jgi:hypothetical protein
MNEYARGALEALAWFDSLMSQARSTDATLELLKREVNGAKDELLQGVAIDFRARLRASWAFK